MGPGHNGNCRVHDEGCAGSGEQDTGEFGAMSLVKIHCSLIVNTDTISRVERCGNYTIVILKGDEAESWKFKQQWDPDCALWNALSPQPADHVQSHADQE